MATRLKPLAARPILFAHRGAMAHERQNTVAAFDLALRLGASGIETDVWLTRDGRPVLDHDGLARRFPLRRRIADVHRDRLPPHIPDLSELLDRTGAGIDVSIDVKDVAAAEAVVEEVDRMAERHSCDLRDRVWLCLPDWEELARWRQRWDRIRLVNSVRKERIAEGPEMRGARLADAGIDAINMHYSDWSGGLTTLFHRFGRLTFGWDAQHERVIAELLDIGIDAIYSDHVDRMVAVAVRMGVLEEPDVAERPDS